MIRYKDYKEALFNAMEGIADRVYLERPQAISSDKKVNSFIVVDVSGFLNNKELDPSGSYDYYTGQAYVSIFVRDKVTSKAMNQERINTLDDLMQKVHDKFPVVDRERGVKFCRPRFMVSASDEDGFHYSLISVRLTTYF
jgi:hypothetical protein